MPQMKGVGLIDNFGLNVPKTDRVKARSWLTIDYMQWRYDLKYWDWLNEKLESTLTAFTHEPQLEAIFEMNIDTELD